jgi:AraC-like DNA-binding protein
LVEYATPIFETHLPDGPIDATGVQQISWPRVINQHRYIAACGANPLKKIAHRLFVCHIRSTKSNSRSFSELLSRLLIAATHNYSSSSVCKQLSDDTTDSLCSTSHHSDFAVQPEMINRLLLNHTKAFLLLIQPIFSSLVDYFYSADRMTVSSQTL